MSDCGSKELANCSHHKLKLLSQLYTIADIKKKGSGQDLIC